MKLPIKPSTAARVRRSIRAHVPYMIGFAGFISCFGYVVSLYVRDLTSSERAASFYTLAVVTIIIFVIGWQDSGRDDNG